MRSFKNFLNPSLLFIDDKMTYALQVIFASLLLALSAQISIPLPFTPIPFTMQTLAVLLIGVTLKGEKGTLAILLYLLQGCLGAPVFAGGGAGFTRLFGPTGGYLMAYPLEVFFIGICLKGEKQSALKTFFVLISASYLQLALGSFWLSQFVGIKICFAKGFFPFLMGDIVKASLITFSMKLRKNNP